MDRTSASTLSSRPSSRSSSGLSCNIQKHRKRHSATPALHKEPFFQYSPSSPDRRTHSGARSHTPPSAHLSLAGPSSLAASFSLSPTDSTPATLFTWPGHLFQVSATVSPSTVRMPETPHAHPISRPAYTTVLFRHLVSPMRTVRPPMRAARTRCMTSPPFTSASPLRQPRAAPLWTLS